MRHSILFLATVLIAGATPARAAERTFDFESDKLGAAPAGFELARTGGGPEGKWVVEADKDNPKNKVLAQTSADTTDYRFPLAVVKDGSYTDVTLSVRARPVSGEVDQAFGLVWRYRDANNYYITRCNADEDNCTIYHVVKGSRRAFQNKGAKISSNTWHTLKVEAVGDRFVVSFNGENVLEAKDETFKEAGKVGLWTKADSVIQFDDLTIEGR